MRWRGAHSTSGNGRRDLLGRSGMLKRRGIMLKIVVLSLATLSIAACTTTERRAAGGALIGGGTGAVIGGIAGGGTGAAIGAGVGAGTGAVIGAATSPGDCYAYDRYGRRVAVRC
jgi:uncharacterized protein YcfJ